MILELFIANRVQVHLHYYFFFDAPLFIMTCFVLKVAVEQVAVFPFSDDTSTFQYFYFLRVIVSM